MTTEAMSVPAASRPVSKLALFGGVTLAVLLVLGAIGTWLRFTQGLGAVTNLNDNVPWGIWIGLDIMGAVALAASGFVAAFTAHVMRIERYHAHVRGGVLAALLGYGFLPIALLFDVGRPLSLWHPIVMPNIHSVMAEVALCVGLYTTVLALEFSPVVLRRLNWRGPLQIINRLYIVFVITGVVLSVLHQSSLGALYLLAPTKLHPLWYSELLPYEFLITAVTAGLAMLIIEATFLLPAESRTRRRNLPQLGEYAAVLLLTYLAVRLADIWVHDRFAIGLDLETAFFLAELGLGVILPAVLFFVPAVQRSRRGVFWAACLVVFGVLLYRGNVAVTGLIAYTGEVYFPSFWEIVITLALIAAEIALFIWIMRSLVLPDEARETREVTVHRA